MSEKMVEISVVELDYLRSRVMDYLRETNIANHMGSDDDFTERMCKIGDDIVGCFCDIDKLIENKRMVYQLGLVEDMIATDTDIPIATDDDIPF